MKQRSFFSMKGYFFLLYFGLGGLFPLLTVYLQSDVGLSGAQIGVITSIGPVIMIMVQPLWGMLSDYTRKPKIILVIASIGAGCSGFTYLFAAEHFTFVIIASLVAVFQSAMIPLSDSIAMNYVKRNGGDYGKIRMWGAVGFAVAVWIMGNLSDLLGLEVIFYGFAIVLLMSSFFAANMPNEPAAPRVDVKEGMRQLVKVDGFILFLIITFLVYGPIMANNFYFGVLIQSVGGTLAGVGFAFLLAAGSEVPFMRWAGAWIQKRGILIILFSASFVSGARWIFYATGPDPSWIYITTVMQGFSIGLFVPAALQYVTDIAPKDVKATAVSIYAAVGNGIGAFFFSMTAGLLIDFHSILAVYLFYGIMTLTGTVLLFILARKQPHIVK
ncbi:MFS transporter, PPP family, 3-phenylpropionic acid transporter [Alkalicoccus daliensis]|uniref:MFS transporter, PPP family, 3-phenylpropionic acid transporter n=2 Tax=Alkalicoccus daliensis TaxID=745820 RepID=A0A1H0H280_9BACI|nr:MFS transporter, PPP family, 3-phenylpropionic acid transporter [Alkalicoccus daliensis]